MHYLIKAEILKILKQKENKILFCILFGYFFLMCVFCITNKSYFSINFMIENEFSTLQWVPIVLMIFSVSRMSVEYQNSTLKSYIFREKKKYQIILSKYFILTITTCFIYLCLLIFDLLLARIVFNISLYNKIIKYTVLWSIGSFAETLLLVTFVFFLTILFKQAILSIAVGILFYLMVGLVGGSMFELIRKYSFLRWNIINLLNFKGQLIDPKMINQTHLSNLDFIGAIVAYIIIFVISGIYIFERKEN